MWSQLREMFADKPPVSPSITAQSSAVAPPASPHAMAFNNDAPSGDKTNALNALPSKQQPPPSGALGTVIPTGSLSPAAARLYPSTTASSSTNQYRVHHSPAMLGEVTPAMQYTVTPLDSFQPLPPPLLAQSQAATAAATVTAQPLNMQRNAILSAPHLVHALSEGAHYRHLVHDTQQPQQQLQQQQPPVSHHHPMNLHLNTATGPPNFVGMNSAPATISPRALTAANHYGTVAQSPTTTNLPTGGPPRSPTMVAQVVAPPVPMNRPSSFRFMETSRALSELDANQLSEIRRLEHEARYSNRRKLQESYLEGLLSPVATNHLTNNNNAVVSPASAASPKQATPTQTRSPTLASSVPFASSSAVEAPVLFSTPLSVTLASPRARMQTLHEHNLHPLN